MIINDLDGYYIVFDTKNWNTELDTLLTNLTEGFQLSFTTHLFPSEQHKVVCNQHLHAECGGAATISLEVTTEI